MLESKKKAKSSISIISNSEVQLARALKKQITITPSQPLIQGFSSDEPYQSANTYQTASFQTPSGPQSANPHASHLVTTVLPVTQIQPQPHQPKQLNQQQQQKLALHRHLMAERPQTTGRQVRNKHGNSSNVALSAILTQHDNKAHKNGSKSKRSQYSLWNENPLVTGKKDAKKNMLQIYTSGVVNRTSMSQQQFGSSAQQSATPSRSFLIPQQTPNQKLTGSGSTVALQQQQHPLRSSTKKAASVYNLAQVIKQQSGHSTTSLFHKLTSHQGRNIKNNLVGHAASHKTFVSQDHNQMLMLGTMYGSATESDYGTKLAAGSNNGPSAKHLLQTAKHLKRKQQKKALYQLQRSATQNSNSQTQSQDDDLKILTSTKPAKPSKKLKKLYIQKRTIDSSQQSSYPIPQQNQHQRPRKTSKVGAQKLILKSFVRPMTSSHFPSQSDASQVVIPQLPVSSLRASELDDELNDLHSDRHQTQPSIAQKTTDASPDAVADAIVQKKQSALTVKVVATADMNEATYTNLAEPASSSAGGCAKKSSSSYDSNTTSAKNLKISKTQINFYRPQKTASQHQMLFPTEAARAMQINVSNGTPGPHAKPSRRRAQSSTQKSSLLKAHSLQQLSQNDIVKMQVSLVKQSQKAQLAPESQQLQRNTHSTASSHALSNNNCSSSKKRDAPVYSRPSQTHAGQPMPAQKKITSHHSRSPNIIINDIENRAESMNPAKHGNVIDPKLHSHSRRRPLRLSQNRKFFRRKSANSLSVSQDKRAKKEKQSGEDLRAEQRESLALKMRQADQEVGRQFDEVLKKEEGALRKSGPLFAKENERKSLVVEQLKIELLEEQQTTERQLEPRGLDSIEQVEQNDTCANEGQIKQKNQVQNLDLIQPVVEMGGKHEQQMQRESSLLSNRKRFFQKKNQQLCIGSACYKRKQRDQNSLTSTKDPLSRYMRLMSNDTWMVELEQLGKNLDSLKHQERQLYLQRQKSSSSLNVNASELLDHMKQKKTIKQQLQGVNSRSRANLLQQNITDYQQRNAMSTKKSSGQQRTSQDERQSTIMTADKAVTRMNYVHPRSSMKNHRLSKDKVKGYHEAYQLTNAGNTAMATLQAGTSAGCQVANGQHASLGSQSRIVNINTTRAGRLSKQVQFDLPN